MKCEKCNKEGAKYLIKKPVFNNSVERKKANWSRKDFKTKCLKCNSLSKD